ncbi:hypothetical protein [Jeotgalibacillus marinus]|uniref:Phage protein n=1 Tax=Jeotgalibacillus marinus TaxID=86667 RepID=A0ABV3PZS7_9BACL
MTYQKELDRVHELLFEFLGEEEGTDLRDETVIAMALTKYEEFLLKELNK